jgi:CubicO group peptidase (beta-lactamase class C family)
MLHRRKLWRFIVERKRNQRTIASFLTLLWLLICTAAANSQVSPDQIDAVFASLESKKAPGAAVLVVHYGQVVFQSGYGVTDLRTLHKIDATASCTTTIMSPIFSPSFPLTASPSPSAIC